MDKKISNKLKEIEYLLNNEDELEKYINKLENTKVSCPNKLEERILNKVTKEKISYFNIIKMVACMILAIILCQMDFIKNGDYIYNSNEPKKEIAKVKEPSYIDNKMNEISSFFMKPINMEKGEK